MQADRDLTLAPGGAPWSELARRLGFAGFWRWWGAQLATWMPTGARTAVRRRRMRPTLAFDSDAATLWVPALRDGVPVMEERARIALGGNADAIAAAGRDAVATLASVVYGGTVAQTRLVVALPARWVLRKRITLPAAVEENLRQALAYDLDRHTPFKPDELYFDAVVVGHDAAHKSIQVELAAARRAHVDQAWRQAEAWGARVVAVTPDRPDANDASRLNLLPDDARPDAAPWKRWQFLAPLALLAIVAAVAVVLPVWQKREYAIALNREAELARGAAAVSEALRQELDRLVADYNFALERKYAFPSAAQVLDEVTRILPDDTWITQFEQRTIARGKEPQRELGLRGESANAGRLVTLLEESPLIMQAAPRSPTTKIQPGPGEMFDLGAQLEPLPATPAQPLAPPASAADGAGAPAPMPPPASGTAATTAPAAIATPAPIDSATIAKSPAPPAAPAEAVPAMPVAGPTPGPAPAPAPAKDRP